MTDETPDLFEVTVKTDCGPVLSVTGYGTAAEADEHLKFICRRNEQGAGLVAWTRAVFLADVDVTACSSLARRMLEQQRHSDQPEEGTP